MTISNCKGLSTSEKATLNLLNAGEGKFAAIKLKSDNSIHFIRDFETQMIINKDGNVGIGTQYPTVKLQVENEAATSVKIVAKGNYDSKLWMMNNKGSYGFGIDKDGKGHIYENINTSNPIMSFANGQVNIGTQTIVSGNHADYKLAVDGKIVGKSLHTTQLNWADDVFAPSYNLISLNELENYILQQKHLPDVPLEEEMKEKGNDLAKTDAMLLRKIEELTLYVIQVKKENEALKQEINQLKKK